MLSRILFALALSASMTSFAQAQSAFDTCGCVVPALGGTTFIGRVTSATGELVVSTPTGPETAFAGTPIAATSQLQSGARSAATLQFSTGCSVSIGALESVVISQPAGPSNPICVQVNPPAPATIGQTTVGLSGTDGFIIGFGSAVIGTGIVINELESRDASR